MGLCYEHLSYVERLSIDEGLRAGLSLRAIARRLNRAASTISRDIRRVGKYWPQYSAPPVFFNALYRRSQSRSGRRKLLPGKPLPGKPLFDQVAALLRQGWSPLQIAGRLRRMDPTTRPGAVSHESIYQALYALPRGELCCDLISMLRQGRQNRRPRSRGTDRRQGFVTEDIRIAQRPEEVIGRLIPGHPHPRTLGGRPDQGRCQPLCRRHTGRTHQPPRPSRPHGCP